jgi:putative hydrolase of the HAD superfamily
MVSNLSIPNQALAGHLRDYWLSEAGFRAYEDAEHTLKELKNSGFQLITISNVSSSRNLATYLRKAGLLEYFDMLIASGDVGFEKPSPEIFRIASRLSKTPVEKILHVGDKYEEDYLGPRAAGVNAILIDRRGEYGGQAVP